MSTWVTVRGYLLQFVVPIAIKILSNVIGMIRPEAILKITEFFQGIYDKAVVDGDKTIQSIIVSIVAPLFGITIVLAPAAPDVLSVVEIAAAHDEMLYAAVEKVVKEEEKKADPGDILNPQDTM